AVCATVSENVSGSPLLYGFFSTCSAILIGFAVVSGFEPWEPVAVAAATAKGRAGGVGIACRRKARQTSMSTPPEVLTPIGCRYARRAASKGGLDVPSMGPS